MSDEIRPFTIDVSDRVLDDLRARLGNTRWPDAELVADWSQGIPLAYVREVCDYWAHSYDWRAREAALNRFDQFVTQIDFLVHYFLEQKHLAAGVVGRSQRGAEHRANGAAESARRTAQHLVAILFLKFIFFSHYVPPESFPPRSKSYGIFDSSYLITLFMVGGRIHHQHHR